MQATTKVVCVALVLCLASITFAAVEVALLARSARPNLQNTLENANRTVIEVGATARHVELASREWTRASKKQSDAATATLLAANRDLERFGVALGHFDALITTTNESLNKGVMPEAEKSLVSLQSLAAGLRPSLESLARTTHNLEEISQSPAVPETLRNIRDTTGNLSDTTASVDRDAQMLETRLRQALKPASLAKRTFLWLLGVVPPVVTAAK